jgi:predicted methyltransferase
MNTAIKSAWLVTGLALGIGFSAASVAELAPGFNAALMSDARPAEEKVRDAARMPTDVLNFVGINAGMDILEISAGAGWYTEILSAAVGSNGSVIAQNAPRFEERVGEAAHVRAERLGNVEVRFTGVGELGLMNEVDAAFTALNLHDAANQSEARGLAFLAGIYAALKPGAVLGFVDHVGIDGQDNADLHRIQKARALDLLSRAGFDIEASSNMLMNPADDHTLSIRDESLGRATDRMLIRARKPL